MEFNLRKIIRSFHSFFFSSLITTFLLPFIYPLQPLLKCSIKLTPSTEVQLFPP